MEKTLTFIHISDTHLGAKTDYVHRGFQPYERMQRLVGDIKRLPIVPDFIVHTGDVCGDKDSHATLQHYALAKPLLESLPAPLYYLLGNHDCKQSLFGTLASGPYTVMYENDRELMYEFSVRGFSCIALHSSVAFERAGRIGSRQLGLLEAHLSTSAVPCCIFLHHPPITVGSLWMDQNMLLSDGGALHSIIKKFSDRVMGVFFGHIHQNLHFLKDGVSYFSSPGSIFQFSTFPNDDQPLLEQQSHVGYSVIRIREGHLQVHSRIVPNSQSSG